MRWTLRAEEIPDPALRRAALDNLRDAVWHIEVAAMLATLAPRALRRDVVTAQVALEVAYDYLDTLTEQRVDDQLANGLTLYAAVVDAVDQGPARDYYAHHPRREDGGYLDALVETCASRYDALPSAGTVRPVVLRTARQTAVAQARTHATDALGIQQLADWAASETGQPLQWWEAAAGMAASVVGMHALIATAARPMTSTETAAELAELYLPLCSLTTLLDSYDDRARDLADGSHSFVGYYANLGRALAGIASVAQYASARAAAMNEDRHHHLVMVAGVAGFYLSGYAAQDADAIGRVLPRSIRPIVAAIVSLFRVWRAAH